MTGASQAVLRKLQALLNRLNEAMAKIGPDRYLLSSFDAGDFAGWFDRWTQAHAELVATEPELSDLPTPRAPPVDSHGKVWREHVDRMRSAIRDALDVLTHPTKAIAQVSLDREGVFAGGQSFDAMLAIASIVRSASRSIDVVDGYVSPTTLGVLAAKGDNVTTTILTSSRSANEASFKTHAQTFLTQYGKLEVRTSNAFHDRFVIVDRADCYHLGASIKDAAKKSAFMFSRIEEPSIVKAFLALHQQEWTAGAVVQL